MTVIRNRTFCYGQNNESESIFGVLPLYPTISWGGEASLQQSHAAYAAAADHPSKHKFGYFRIGGSTGTDPAIFNSGRVYENGHINQERGGSDASATNSSLLDQCYTARRAYNILHQE